MIVRATTRGRRPRPPIRLGTAGNPRAPLRAAGHCGCSPLRYGAPAKAPVPLRFGPPFGGPAANPLPGNARRLAPAAPRTPPPVPGMGFATLARRRNAPLRAGGGEAPLPPPFAPRRRAVPGSGQPGTAAPLHSLRSCGGRLGPPRGFAAAPPPACRRRHSRAASGPRSGPPVGLRLVRPSGAAGSPGTSRKAAAKPQRPDDGVSRRPRGVYSASMKDKTNKPANPKAGHNGEWPMMTGSNEKIDDAPRRRGSSEVPKSGRKPRVPKA